MDGDTTPQAHNAAPTSPATESAAPGATHGGVKGKGKPGGSQGPRVGHAQRRAARKLASEVAISKENERLRTAEERSRARAQREVCEDVSGRRDGVPMPLSVACSMRGLPLHLAVAMLERGEAPQLAQARAEGHALCIRKACGDGPDARQWAWLAERLNPKELHLPTRITGVSPEDGGAPIASVQVTLSRDEAMQLARGQVPTLPQQVQARALPKGR